MTEREKVLARLAELGIGYELFEHPAVTTIEEMDTFLDSQTAADGARISPFVVKNLFLRDAKGRRHFLVVLDKEKRADLKKLAAEIGSTPLGFASAERLQKYLGLVPGEVTPLAVLNDIAHAVEVLLDADVAARPCVGVHPNDNTATLLLATADLKRYFDACGASVRIVRV